MTTKADATNPAHYKRFPVEVIEISRHLDFDRGNAVKYLARAGFKEGADELEDLEKALWYVQDAIAEVKRKREAQKHPSEVQVAGGSISTLGSPVLTSRQQIGFTL